MSKYLEFNPLLLHGTEFKYKPIQHTKRKLNWNHCIEGFELNTKQWSTKRELNWHLMLKEASQAQYEESTHKTVLKEVRTRGLSRGTSPGHRPLDRRLANRLVCVCKARSHGAWRNDNVISWSIWFAFPDTISRQCTRVFEIIAEITLLVFQFLA